MLHIQHMPGGVAILLSKVVSSTIHKVVSDPGGRNLIIVADIFTCKMVLANVYPPPPFQVQLLYDLLGKMAPFMHLTVLMAGDFNTILDTAMYSYNLTRASSYEFSAWVDSALVDAASLTELWRWKNAAVRNYSHLSKTHRSSSRIEMAFANALLLQFVE